LLFKLVLAAIFVEGFLDAEVPPGTQTEKFRVIFKIEHDKKNNGRGGQT